jgi:DNA-binding NarL/FixJ family response regulator
VILLKPLSKDGVFPFRKDDRLMPLDSRPSEIRVAIVHPTSIIRIGLLRVLEAGFAKSQLSSYPSWRDFAASPAAYAFGDVALIDVNEWTRRPDPSASQKLFVGLIGAAKPTPCTKLMEAKGLKGALSVEAEPEEFLAMALALSNGMSFFAKKDRRPAVGMERLSHRQLEILELMTRGLLNKQIAWELGLTEGTVKSHVSAILEKLNCSRRTQAIAAFMQSLGMGGQLATA